MNGGTAAADQPAAAAPADQAASTDRPAQAAPAANMPMFYARPEPLQAEAHADLKLKDNVGYAFARRANVIPLNISEMAIAARFYPVVFVGDTDPVPVAVVGLRQNENLFVDDEGRWRKNTYVPAYVRRYPFILITDQERSRYSLCVDRAAPHMSTQEGAALFENGEATEAARHALEFSRLYQAHAMATGEAMSALAGQNLFVSNQVNVALPDGESLSLTDFKIVDQKKFEALDDEVFLKLRKVHAIGPVYCHLVSIDKWSDLSALMR